MLQAAVDHNGNGTVDAGEVDPASTKYLCNGADGAQGIQGPAGSMGPQGEPGALALYGDGSAGNLNIPENSQPRNLIYGYGTLPNGANLMFQNVYINAVVFVASGVTIRATGDITIGPQGILVVDPERSMQTVNRPTRGIAVSMPEDSQGGRGLDLGRSAVLTRFDLSGGGAGFRPKIANAALYSGSEGGGRVVLAAKGNINLNGLIDANGRNGGIPSGSALPGGGGGGGGVVTLVSRGTITLGTNGSIRAQGGNGANAVAGATGQLYGGGGGGGGGVIQILSAYQPVIPTPANLNVSGGTAGSAAVTGTATTLAAMGGGGGGSGGDGGDGTKSTAASGAAVVGVVGDLSVTVTPQPELLFY